MITLKLGGEPKAPWPTVSLAANDAVEVIAGPVRVRSRREVCWNVKAQKPGGHSLLFQVGDSVVRQGTRDRRRLHAGEHRAAGLGLVENLAEPVGTTVPAGRSGVIRSRSPIPSALRGRAAPGTG